jgi:hypothetical protein
MTGDGTNDAPALAQADVAVAMNTGTQAAKEAGNMVDLDSNPTKLIEIVEIGKQLLMTRGALTTFSIANDVAKYFAIIPAAFAATYPALGALNVMGLHSPQSAILSRRHLQRAHHRRAHPARAARHATCWSTASAACCCRSPASSSSTSRCGDGRQLTGPAMNHTASLLRPRPALSCSRSSRVWRTPCVVTGVAQAAFPAEANGSLIRADDRVIGSSLIGQPFEAPATSGGGRRRRPHPYNGAASTGLEPRSRRTRRCTRPCATACRRSREARSAEQSAGPRRPRDDLGERPRPARLARGGATSAARGAGARAARGGCARSSQHVEGRTLGVLGEPRVNVLRSTSRSTS